MPGLYLALSPDTAPTREMKRCTHITGRSSSFTPNVFTLSARRLSAAILTVVLQCPAFFSSCMRGEPLPESAVPLAWDTKSPVPETLDLFFFETEGAERLDSYQQIRFDAGGNKAYGLSSGGEKRLVALSGISGETARWGDINTFGNLRKHRFSLDRESPQEPLLSAQTVLQPGASRTATLHLRPQLAAIRFHSVSCDFLGRPYAGELFHNTRIFIIYAGTECLPLEEGDGKEPVSLVNIGFLDSTAVMALPHPEMLLQEGCGRVGVARVYPDRDFYCYPGPRTRLVLEGRVGGHLCYYPIGLDGLAPGERLSLDVTLRRMGSDHPDTPAESGSISIESTILPWEDREAQTIIF